MEREGGMLQSRISIPCRKGGDIPQSRISIPCQNPVIAHAVKIKELKASHIIIHNKSCTIFHNIWCPQSCQGECPWMYTCHMYFLANQLWKRISKDHQPSEHANMTMHRICPSVHSCYVNEYGWIWSRASHGSTLLYEESRLNVECVPNTDAKPL